MSIVPAIKQWRIRTLFISVLKLKPGKQDIIWRVIVKIKKNLVKFNRLPCHK
ncbi:conserved hypothetical protein [Xenorhabdus nematophila F1]|uniref:Uncharacterized protein n=1 Tax=Xenorhabdus nematophila (strain ATCC 19061 / DSM 3370 / CCUG 14189 / LMG 1036 / NCIMB 9965 / AN6) TaxID=406817 RepID=D3VEM5_XENNA|nr:hypothetical protein XNC1_2077 [Xenorhabdus nematophila ATCC 19061]CCW32117.1 conserved hypothetical protein [Xenorhabdus nematophila F1]